MVIHHFQMVDPQFRQLVVRVASWRAGSLAHLELPCNPFKLIPHHPYPQYEVVSIRKPIYWGGHIE